MRDVRSTAARPPSPPHDAAPSAQEPKRSRRTHFLMAGQFCVHQEPVDVVTILGSCVAVCLWDDQRRVGGMNHFLLPAGGHPEAPDGARYGDVAVSALVQALYGAGCRPQSLEAKVFGGARTFGSKPPGPRDIGTLNIAAARQALSRYGVEIVSEDVGGPRGRKVIFSLSDGSAWVRTL